MGLFDDEKTNRIADTVKETNLQEESINQVQQEQHVNRVGRPPVNKKERKQSYPITMSPSLLEEIDDYKNTYFPKMSRSAVVVELLEEILEQKSN